MEIVNLWQELDLIKEEKWECTNDNVGYNKKLYSERVFQFLTGLNQELDEERRRFLNR